jgi:hypothetical protein
MSKAAAAGSPALFLELKLEFEPKKGPDDEATLSLFGALSANGRFL